ncbi:MAG: hypothetical protein NC124_00215 [Clostridium sp.]|nr:hypothetical protein [Clostridium sp.]
MGLFGKKQSKFYLVIDPYSEEATAACETKEIKQILQVLPAAKFVECNSYEYYQFKDHNVAPDNVKSRKRLEAKEIK